MRESRHSRVKVGMTFAEVKEIFGEDIWYREGLGDGVWLVNNETDDNPDHGYVVQFDKEMKVKGKWMFSCA